MDVEFNAPMQTFTTGATRSSDEGKHDYEGFISPAVLEEFGAYMLRHQVQADGQIRESDNWQKGMPILSYRKSLIRHMIELWGLTRGHISARLKREYPGKSLRFLIRETTCACFFNLQGFLHEFLKEEEETNVDNKVLAALEIMKQRDTAA